MPGYPPPPDVQRARDRLYGAAKAFATNPVIVAKFQGADKMLEDFDVGFADRSRWPAIVVLSRDLEAATKTVVVHQPMQYGELEQIVSVVELFVKRLMTEVWGESRSTAAFAAGYIRSSILYDPELQAVIPSIYTKVRLELLGVPSQ